MQHRKIFDVNTKNISKIFLPATEQKYLLMVENIYLRHRYPLDLRTQVRHERQPGVGDA